MSASHLTRGTRASAKPDRVEVTLSPVEVTLSRVEVALSPVEVALSRVEVTLSRVEPPPPTRGTRVEPRWRRRGTRVEPAWKSINRAHGHFHPHKQQPRTTSLPWKRLFVRAEVRCQDHFRRGPS